MILHPFRSLDPDQIEAASDDLLRRCAEREPKALGVGPEDALVVVEAMKVVRDPDRLVRDPMRRAALRGFPRDPWKLQQPLDELSLLDREGS